MRTRLKLLSSALSALLVLTSCLVPAGPGDSEVSMDGGGDGTLTADDCDDADASVTAVAEDADCDGALTDDDGDDAAPNIGPGATEECDEVDSDCDGSLVDEFSDLDGDGAPDCVDPDDGVDQDCDLP